MASTFPKTRPFRWRTTRTKLTFHRSVHIRTAAPPRTRTDFLRNRKTKTGRIRGAPPPFIFFPRSLLLLDLRVALEPKHAPIHDQTQPTNLQTPPPSPQQMAAPSKKEFAGNENTPKTGKQASSPFRFFQSRYTRWHSSRVLGSQKERTIVRPNFKSRTIINQKIVSMLLLSFRRPRPHTHLQQSESSAVVAIPSISPSRLPAHINVNVISFTSFTSNSCLHKLHSS